MRKLLFLIFGFFVFSYSFGQTAKDWLDRLSKTYSQIPTYYIKFEVKEGNSKPETGELFAAKDKYSLDVLGINQMYDGKTLYTVLKEDKEVTVSKPQPDSDDLLTPTKVIKMYKTGFNYTLENKEKINGKNIQFIKLTPITTSEASYMQVGISTNDNTLYQYKEVYKDGTFRTITVKEYLESLIIPKTLFKFDQSKYEKDGYIVTPI